MKLKKKLAKRKAQTGAEADRKEQEAVSAQTLSPNLNAPVEENLVKASQDEVVARPS